MDGPDQSLAANARVAVGFFDLPRELRDIIYCYLLVSPKTGVQPGREWSCYPDMGPSLKVLLLNKQVYHEAAAILYGCNRFKICFFDSFANFLVQIGPANAGLLRHLEISFPDLYHDDGDVFLREDRPGIRALNLLHERGNVITTLKTGSRSSGEFERWLEQSDCPQTVDEALTLVDEKVRTLCRLQEFQVELPYKPKDTALRKGMRSRGWTIITGEAELSGQAKLSGR